MRFTQRTALAITSAAVVTAAAIAVPVTTAGATPRAATTTAAVSKAGTLTSHVFGTFGKFGKVRGTYTPVRSFTRGGKVYTQGVLRATLRRGSGALVGRVVRQDVRLPLHQSATTSAARTSAALATCAILHLTLGPLDLNLLGLTVHLNRVVLNIDAVSGAGNLLGNLLCAVANLLNGVGLPTLTQLLQISNLVNQIIGILT
jgi:hypothetical protein